MMRLLCARRGAAAVEFALIGPVLLTLVFGIIEAAQLYWARNALTFAAQEAGRYVIAHPTATTSDITAYARRRVLGVDPASVTATVASDVASGTTFLTVRLSSRFTFLQVVPLAPVNLTASSRVPLV